MGSLGLHVLVASRTLYQANRHGTCKKGKGIMDAGLWMELTQSTSRPSKEDESGGRRIRDIVKDPYYLIKGLGGHVPLERVGPTGV